LSATSHPAFSNTVLPWAAKRGTYWLTSYFPRRGYHVAAELRIAIEQQELGSGGGGPRFPQLLHDPESIGISCHVAAQNLASAVQEPVHEQDQVSTTDPDSTYATKGGTPARLGYYDNYLVDNPSCVIVGVQATAARMSQETVAAQDMLTRFAQWQGGEPSSIAADATYGNGEFLQWLLGRGITPYMRTRDSALRKNNPGYGPERYPGRQQRKISEWWKGRLR
jgi:DDE family transposase